VPFQWQDGKKATKKGISNRDAFLIA